MTEIRIVCVGKVKEAYFRDGIASSLKFIEKKYRTRLMECEDEATPDDCPETVRQRILDREGERILSKISREDYVIALCIEGKPWTSDGLAKVVRARMSQLARSGGNLVFVIGGSLGLSAGVLSRADEQLSFSAMTFPHQMMRLILADQLASIVRKDLSGKG